jgi:hypothetical protein
LLVSAASFPILAGIYMASATAGLRHHRMLARAVVVVAIAAVGAVSILQLAPKPASAYRSEPVDTGAIARLTAPIVTDLRPTQSAVLQFSVPMDPSSVEQNLSVEPGTAVTLKWSDSGTSVSVIPKGSWEPATFYTITVGTGAHSRTGEPLPRPIRSVILTRPVPTATIAATKISQGSALTSTAFTITFSRAIDVGAVTEVFSIKPAVKGALVASTDATRADRFTFTPTKALKAGTTYVLTFSGPLADEDGLVVSPVPRLEIRTAAPITKVAPSATAGTVAAAVESPSADPTVSSDPTVEPDPTASADPTAAPAGTVAPTPTPRVERPQVVRFRPRDGWADVSTSQAVSVRFTKPMEHASTQASFKLSGYDMKKGSFSWWENDTVLVFEPDQPLANGKKYTLSIVPGAVSKDGQPIIIGKGKRAVTAVFTVARKPAAANDRPSGRPAEPPVAKPTNDAPWLDVEQFALKLLNCTRTGGRIQTDGTCDGYGSGKYSAYRPPLKLDSSISSGVARAYAKYQAVRHACNHFLDGDPGDRMARAGYRSPHWAENIGCRPTPTRQAVINSAIFFQDEQYASYRGHWINLKNPDYDRVGIGVWESGGWVLSVYNFYRP